MKRNLLVTGPMIAMLIIGNFLVLPATVNAFSGGGSGTLADPYKISNVTQLQEIADDLSACYILVNDIDASDTADWNDGAGFDPIGSYYHRFNGNLNGNGFKIINLSIFRPEEGGGLFGYVDSSGMITDLVLENADLDFYWEAGAVAGFNYGTIINSCATGYVDSLDDSAGGLVAYNYGQVINCHAMCSVDGEQGGGLVGSNNGKITNSCANSNVSGDYWVGGLVGNNKGQITSCYANGNVWGDYCMGGLVGNNEGEITASYAFDDISRYCRLMLKWVFG